MARGIPALTLTTVPDGAVSGLRRRPAQRSGARLGELGRATQNLVGSLDAGLELTQGTTSYVYLGTRIVRGWAIEFVLLTALLPFLIGAVDLFARCRRRRIALAPAAAACAAACSSGDTRACCSSPPRGSAPFRTGSRGRCHPTRVYHPSPVVLGVIGALLVAGWLIGRERLIPRRAATLEETLAGHTVALLAPVSSRSSSSRRIRSPSSTCCRRCTPGSGCPRPMRRTLVRGRLLTLGLAGPLILMLSFATRFDLGGEAPWYLLSLVAAGYVPGWRCSRDSSGSRSRHSWRRSSRAVTPRFRTSGQAVPAAASALSSPGPRFPAGRHASHDDARRWKADEKVRAHPRHADDRRRCRRPRLGIHGLEVEDPFTATLNYFDQRELRGEFRPAS